MVTFVVVCNTLIAFANFYFAWRIWQLRPVLKRAANTLDRVERRVHYVLFPAPAALVKGKTATSNLRERYQQLEQQWQQLLQLMALINRTLTVLQRVRRVKS